MNRERRRSRSPARSRDDSKRVKERRRKDSSREREYDRETRHKDSRSHKRGKHRELRHHEQYSDTDSGNDTGSSVDSREERKRRRKKRERHERERKERRKRKQHKKDKRREYSSTSSSSSSSSNSDSASDDASDVDIDHRKLEKLGANAITNKDYFAKSTEFRVWLREKKKRYLEDLKSSDARGYFKKFIKAWNSGKLDDKYYSGIRSSQLASSDLTKYQWGFAKKMNQEEVLAVRDNVDTATNSERVARDLAQRTQGHRDTSRSETLGMTDRHARSIGPSMPQMPGSSRSSTAPVPTGPYGELMDNEDRRRYVRGIRRKDTKSYRKAREADLEELVPKATGREAMLEKRRARSAYLHREPSPDPELPESDLMGDDDSYQAHLRSLEESRLRRMQYRQETQTQRTTETSEKRAAFQRKEDETMAMFRQMVEQR
ncbi:hypothetical protein BDF22DRAFT_739937 [Syncephalis plumigaleata]|nr:hypothetical protein BDF22DRAFT_739937 [Syncephalis plumigaleata]